MVYRFIGEPGTQVAELQAGRVDIATLIPLGLIETVKKSGNADVISTGGPVAFALRYNTRPASPATATCAARLIMAVDAIVAVAVGPAKTIASFQGPQSFGYNPEQKPLPFNPASRSCWPPPA